jgi:hypothetical protein
MLSVDMLNVVMQSVVAPSFTTYLRGVNFKKMLHLNRIGINRKFYTGLVKLWIERSKKVKKML